MSFLHLSVSELHQLLGQEAVNIVDIRDPAAFNAGHIDKAFNLNNQNIHDYLAQIDKNQTLVVCCYHGHSSQGAADFLSQQGFSTVYSLDGGYQAWQQSLSQA